MTEKDKKTAKRKGIFVRIKPGTLDWLRERVNDDEPSVPAVVREIIEEERRRQTQKPSRRKR